MAGEISAYQEQTFYHYILEDQQLLSITKPDFFTNKNIRLAYEIARDFALEYREAPSKDQMTEIVRVKGYGGELSEDVIIALYNTKVILDQYEKKWLEDNVGAWIKIRNAEYAMRKGLAYFKSSTITAENAAEVVEKLKNIMTTEIGVNLDPHIGVDFFDPEAHKQTRLARTPSGYAYIDKCLAGGWWKGSLIAFLSGAKAGKSLWLQNLAALSCQNGYNTAYITCELQLEIVNMRMGSNMFNIHIDEYPRKSEDSDFLRNRINKMRSESLKPLGELRVFEFPSSTASVTDMQTALKAEEERLGIKFENVFVDYINIMRNWRNPNSENTYMKIKQISEDLRAMAMIENWAVITVTQTNRDGWENEDLRLVNISESAALLHTVDALFGIITSPELKANKIYWLKYMADRVSGMENTRKKYNVEPHYMRIEEDRESDIEDLDAILKSLAASKIPGKKYKDLNKEIKEEKISQEEITGNEITGKELF